jgi:hypothetical protein
MAPPLTRSRSAALLGRPAKDTTTVLPQAHFLDEVASDLSTPLAAIQVQTATPSAPPVASLAQSAAAAGIPNTGASCWLVPVLYTVHLTVPDLGIEGSKISKWLWALAQATPVPYGFMQPMIHCVRYIRAAECDGREAPLPLADVDVLLDALSACLGINAREAQAPAAILHEVRTLIKQGMELPLRGDFGQDMQRLLGLENAATEEMDSCKPEEFSGPAFVPSFTQVRCTTCRQLLSNSPLSQATSLVAHHPGPGSGSSAAGAKAVCLTQLFRAAAYPLWEIASRKQACQACRHLPAAVAPRTADQRINRGALGSTVIVEVVHPSGSTVSTRWPACINIKQRLHSSATKSTQMATTTWQVVGVCERAGSGVGHFTMLTLLNDDTWIRVNDALVEHLAEAPTESRASFFVLRRACDKAQPQPIETPQVNLQALADRLVVFTQKLDQQQVSQRAELDVIKQIILQQQKQQQQQQTLPRPRRRESVKLAETKSAAQPKLMQRTRQAHDDSEEARARPKESQKAVNLASKKADGREAACEVEVKANSSRKRKGSAATDKNKEALSAAVAKTKGKGASKEKSPRNRRNYDKSRGKSAVSHPAQTDRGFVYADEPSVATVFQQRRSARQSGNAQSQGRGRWRRRTRSALATPVSQQTLPQAELQQASMPQPQLQQPFMPQLQLQQPLPSMPWPQLQQCLPYIPQPQLQQPLPSMPWPQLQQCLPYMPLPGLQQPYVSQQYQLNGVPHLGPLAQVYSQHQVPFAPHPQIGWGGGG